MESTLIERTVTKYHNKSIWSDRMWSEYTHWMFNSLIGAKRTNVAVVYTQPLVEMVCTDDSIFIKMCECVFSVVVWVVQHILIVDRFRLIVIIKCHKCRVKELVSILLAAIINSIKRHDIFFSQSVVFVGYRISSLENFK